MGGAGGGGGAAPGGAIEYSPSTEGVASGRYELLNTIMEDKAVGDKDSLASHSDLYAFQNAAVKLFKPVL